MTDTKCLVTHETLPWSECLDCAAHGKKPCTYNYALLRSIERQQQNERTGIHVSDVIHCLRKAYYTATEPAVPTYPHQSLVMLVGTVTHTLLEGDPTDPNIRSEIDLSWDYDGVTVTGRADAYYPHTHTLSDTKTKRGMYLKYLPEGEHTTQVKVYANILRHMGYPVEHGEIQYLDVTGPSKCLECKAELIPSVNERSLTCPKCGQLYDVSKNHLGTVKIGVDVSKADQLDTWISERAHHLHDAILSHTPANAEPGWLCKYCPFVNICPEARP